MQTSPSDKTAPTRRREPLRWIAAAALLLAFLSICCVAQTITFLMAPRNQRSALDLLSKNQAGYAPWTFDLSLPAIAPEVPKVIAADIATATSNAQIAASAPENGGAPTAEMEFVPPVAGAPTPTFVGVNPPTSTPTPTSGAIASGPTRLPIATATDTGAPANTATPQPDTILTPTSSNRTSQPTRTQDSGPTATNAPATNTPKPKATNTPKPPPPATDTPKPPQQPTDTPKPPQQPTDTPKPPQQPTDTPKPKATNTPKPKKTNTPVPPATRTNTPVPPATRTNTPVPPATRTNTPVPPTPTDTPTPTPTDTPTPTPPVTGNVVVTKQVNPTNGTNGTNVVYTIKIVNNTTAPITLNRITDDMTGIGEFNGDGCTYPDGTLCAVPPQPAQWVWNGSLVIPIGGSAMMTISGTFARFLPPTPTPPPAPQSFCNTATVTYNGSTTVNSNQACFTLN